MGIETAAIVMAGVAVGAEIGKSYFQVESAHEQEKAIDLQAKQLELQNQQKTLSNYAVLEKVMDAQAAHMTLTGTSFSSPSFNAIQRNTLNIAARKEENLEIENAFEILNTGIEKENVKNTLYAQLFGNAAEVAQTAASIYSKLPKKSAYVEE